MPPRIIESPWIQKIVNSAVWSSQCSNIKVIPLGKAERIMQELLTEKDKEREEAYTKGRSDEAKTCKGCQGRCEEELQKAREAWLREEIVKLQQEQEDLRDKCRGSYKIIVLTKETEGSIDTLQTIIDRYQSELDQPTDGMPHPFGNPEGVYPTKH